MDVGYGGVVPVIGSQWAVTSKELTRMTDDG
jgi:hypothetical protein